VLLTIKGHHLPGRACGPHTDVHVALQVGKVPEAFVRGDAETAEWRTEIAATADDFRGPAVQGKKGDRFVYLTWGTGSGSDFTMFRRAKLMLSGVPRTQGEVVASIHLTDDHGMPVCARLRPPTVVWS
jgi:hypothetical protein